MTKTYADYCAKLDRLWNAVLSSAIEVYSKPDDVSSFDRAQSAFLSYVGFSEWFHLHWNSDGTPIEREKKTPRKLLVWYEHGGKTVSLFRRDGTIRIVEFTTERCNSRAEANEIASAWANENGKYVCWHPVVKGESQCNYSDDKSLNDRLRADCISRINNLVVYGRKSPRIDLEMMIGQACFEIGRFRSNDIQFKIRWNSEGKWIGPVKKKRAEAKATAIDAD